MAFANNFIYMLRLCENRVSFGSNKGGSMVETLIYENTPTEEDQSGSSSLASATAASSTTASTSTVAASSANTGTTGWNKNGNKIKAQQHLRSVTGYHHHSAFAEEESQPLLR